MAELGETADPRALVPGDPAVIGETVSRLRQYGRLLSEAGEGLRRIDDGGWTGQAADAFRDFFDGHPGEWIRSGDAFTAAADALEPYQRVLEWGQQQAAEAVRTWTEGRAATDRAAAAYEAESASRPPDSPPMPPFSDPGAEKRQHAESMLGLAREQVLNAAEGARSKVAEAKGDLVEARSWLGQLWHGLQDAGEGLVDHIAEYSDTVWKLDPARVWAEPGEVIDDLRNLPAAVQQASANSSAEDLIDLRQFRENPARAAGESVLRFGKLAGPWAVVTTPYQVVEQIQQMRAEKPKHHVFISEERHPESAAHAEDAQNGRTWRGEASSRTTRSIPVMSRSTGRTPSSAVGKRSTVCLPGLGHWESTGMNTRRRSSRKAGAVRACSTFAQATIGDRDRRCVIRWPTFPTAPK